MPSVSSANASLPFPSFPYTTIYAHVISTDASLVATQRTRRGPLGVPEPDLNRLSRTPFPFFGLTIDRGIARRGPMSVGALRGKTGVRLAPPFRIPPGEPGRADFPTLGFMIGLT